MCNTLSVHCTQCTLCNTLSVHCVHSVHSTLYSILEYVNLSIDVCKPATVLYKLFINYSLCVVIAYIHVSLSRIHIIGFLINITIRHTTIVDHSIFRTLVIHDCILYNVVRNFSTPIFLYTS